MKEQRGPHLPFALFSKMNYCVFRNVCAETQLQITQTLTTVVGERQDAEKKTNQKSLHFVL